MFEEFVGTLKKYRCIGVFSHIRPDGDCIGSQVALCRWLEKNGYKVYAFNDDDIPPNLAWMMSFFPVEKPSAGKMAECDLFILVDGNAPHRFGSYKEWQSGHRIPAMMIDHHPDPEDIFDVQVSVDSASSTCELVYNLYKEHNIKQLDTRSAKALYTGIITDTGSLQFDSVTPETVEAVADLLRRGNFTPNTVYEKVFSNRTPGQLKLLSQALGTLQLFSHNQIAVMSVTEEMLKETETANADTEGFVNYLLSIADVKAAVLFKEAEDGVKMSLRSKSEIDVNTWARALGGGGHRKAAGAKHPGPLDKAVRDTIRIGIQQLKPESS